MNRDKVEYLKISAEKISATTTNEQLSVLARIVEELAQELLDLDWSIYG